MDIQFKNYASTTLVNSITSLSSSAILSNGAAFPTLAGAQYFYGVFTDSLTTPTVREIVKVTALVGSTITITRGQDGTTARDWASASYFELRVVNAALEAIYAEATSVSTSIADLADTTDNAKGDALVGFKQANSSGFLTGAIARTVSTKLQEVISVKDFGAVGDNATDDTAAIQAAIDAAAAAGQGTIYFPNGYYKVTSTLNITSSYIGLVGESYTSCKIIPFSDYGDVIYVRPTAPATTVQFIFIADLAIFRGHEATFGAGLRLESVHYGMLSNLFVTEHFGGLLLDSCLHCYFDNLMIATGSFFPSNKAGSYCVKVNKATGLYSTELHFNNCDWTGGGNKYTQYAVWLQEVDGIWFSDLHCGFCYDAAFAILPTSDAMGVVAVVGSNVYCDSTTLYGFHMKEFSATATGNCNALFSGFLSYNCTEAMRIDHAVGSIQVTNFNSIITTNGINLVQAIDSQISQARITDVNKDGTVGYGVYVGAAVDGLTLSNIFVRRELYSATAGIYLEDGAANINVNGAMFESCTANITDNATASSKWFADIKTDTAVPTATPTVGNVLTLNSAYDVFKLAATPAASSIDAASSWKNRKVTLIALGTCTVNDGSNLKLNSQWVAKADETLTLVCDGTNWWEVSRASNVLNLEPVTSRISMGVAPLSTIGVYCTPQIDNANTNTYGLNMFPSLQAGTTMTSNRSIGVGTTVGAGSTVGQNYAIHIADASGAGAVTVNYGLFIDSIIKGGTTNYALYTDGTSNSYFGGNVGLGIAPAVRLHLGTNAAATTAKLESGAAASVVVLQRANTTLAAPAALANNDPIGTLSWQGYHSGAAYSTPRVQVGGYAGEAWTNTANGSYITFSTTPTGSVTMAERVRIDATGNIIPFVSIIPNADDTTVIGAAAKGIKQFFAAYTNSATIGAVTINKMAGRCNVALGATSVVVTNSLVTAASKVFAVCAQNDATAYVKNVVPGAGSFTITIGAAATADTAVDFFVVNAD